MVSSRVVVRMGYAVVLAAVLSACSSFSAVNRCYTDDLQGSARCPSHAKSLPPPMPTRATLAVNGERGNPRVLMFVAFSGGGSRAAYLATETMIALEAYPGADLLAEVDVLSAVSGGALPAAFYAVTRDRSLRLPAGVADRLRQALEDTDVPSQLRIDPDERLTCSAKLEGNHQSWLLARRHAGAHIIDTRTFYRIRDLCEQAALDKLREWSAADARERMSRDFVARMFGNMFLPVNFVRYWFTSYDRSDIMAQTLTDNLFDRPVLGVDHDFGDLNPTRPFLVVHATTATAFPDESEHEKDDDGEADQGRKRDTIRPPFGSSFTFTREDFHQRLYSDVNRYPVGGAVMASSAFPLAFSHVTLENLHSLKGKRECKSTLDTSAECTERRYLHLIDGGNSDNLGLRSVKRMLLEMAAGGRLVENHDAIVVLLVDAFAEPTGASNHVADPRGFLGRLVDMSTLSQAVDVLLQRNRLQTLGEFMSPQELLNVNRDCAQETLQLPKALCMNLERMNRQEAAAVADFLGKRLVFHRIGLDSIAGSAAVKRTLDSIPTSFSIKDHHVKAIHDGVAQSLRVGHPCLDSLAHLVGKAAPGDDDVRLAQRRCGRPSPFESDFVREAKRGNPTAAPIPIEPAARSIRTAKRSATAFRKRAYRSTVSSAASSH